MKLYKQKKPQLFSGFMWVVGLGFGCLFILSSLHKIRQPYDFLSEVYNYELVGPKLGMLAAITLPGLELVLGICLIGGIFLGGALLTTSILMAIFVFAKASVLYRGLAISCGCFSSSSSEIISYKSLLETCLLLVVCLLAYLCLLICQGQFNRSSPEYSCACQAVIGPLSDR